MWQCTPIVPTTWEAEAGVFFELRSFRPTWATQQDSVSKKTKNVAVQAEKSQISGSKVYWNLFPYFSPSPIISLLISTILLKTSISMYDG